jgi:hypothetical protein
VYPSIVRMAPVTRRASATSATKVGDAPATKNVQKNRPLPLKSALRHGLQGPTRTRQVSFKAEDYDNASHVHLPTTPHPITKQTRLPTQEEEYPKPQIDHSKRKEREELVRRAERVTQAIQVSNKEANSLPSPPQSPGRRSPFEEPVEASGEENTQNTSETVKVKKSEPSQAAKPPKEAVLTFRDINRVMDNIPNTLEIPGTVEDILIEPSAEIKMEEICTAFDYLKSEIQIHCRNFYSYNTPAKMGLRSLTALKVMKPELLSYIQYIADGSQYGWTMLLNNGPQRENLVYAIISRALVSYVFNSELFGASAEHEEILLEMCREYLNFDAFVRNTHRAEIIASILATAADEHAICGRDPSTYYSTAINSLERRIDLLLRPIQHPNHGDLGVSAKHQRSLLSIIQTALKIHLAIRLAGADGTVYRFEHMHKLAHWDNQTMNCVNQLKMDLPAHHGDEPLVKICCFPAVFATVPSGPNLEKFTDPDFVEEWKKTTPAADEAKDIDHENSQDKTKPLITTYPITLADVVLENTPSTDRSGFLTLSDTMAREERIMADKKLKILTGASRVRNNRITKLVGLAKKRIYRAAGITAGVVAAAAAAWYVYHHVPSPGSFFSLRLPTSPKFSSLLKQTMSLTPEAVTKATEKAIKATTMEATLSLTPEALTRATKKAIKLTTTKTKTTTTPRTANTTPA